MSFIGLTKKGKTTTKKVFRTTVKYIGTVKNYNELQRRSFLQENIMHHGKT